MKFEEMGLSKPLMDSLAVMGFTTPTPIQEQAIPLLLNGDDLIGQAQTGTGKTAAFGLPILEAFLKKRGAAFAGTPSQYGHHAKSGFREVGAIAPAGNMPAALAPHIAAPHHVGEKFNAHNLRKAQERTGGMGKPKAIPSALILVPTRELAVQVHATMVEMAGASGARVIAVYGGIEMRKQLRMFQDPVDVLVGTPGRTLDHLRQGTLDISQVRTVVLDEADRMLDMGFIRDVVKILDGLPRTRQTMLFSATMPKEVAQIAHKYMKSPKTVKVSEDRLTVDKIKQFYVRSSHGQRLGMLLAAIRKEKPFLSLVFCRMKHEAKRLAQSLKLNGIKADALHGNLDQKQRERAMARFRNGDIEIMVATDLASRGIDVPGITHVFNYELPDDPLTYVHRIGRTGRAGEEGVAISLISGDPRHAIGRIERATGAPISEMPLKPEMPIMPARSEGDRRREEGAHGRGPRQWGEGKREGGYGRPHERREGSASAYGHERREGVHTNAHTNAPEHVRQENREEGHSRPHSNAGAPEHARHESKPGEHSIARAPGHENRVGEHSRPHVAHAGAAAPMHARHEGGARAPEHARRENYGRRESHEGNRHYGEGRRDDAGGREGTYSGGRGAEAGGRRREGSGGYSHGEGQRRDAISSRGGEGGGRQRQEGAGWQKHGRSGGDEGGRRGGGRGGEQGRRGKGKWEHDDSGRHHPAGFGGSRRQSNRRR